MKIHSTLIAIAVLSLVPCAHPEQAQGKNREDVALLMEGLAAPELRDRVKAREALTKWAEKHPEQAKKLLLRNFLHSDEPEIRENCLLLLKPIAARDFGNFGEGYMGISMGNETMLQLPDGNEPCHGLIINTVTNGAPAEKAGLRAGDIIVSINDVTWKNPQTILDLRHGIQAKIRAVGAGKVAQIGIMRKKELLQIPVTLSRRPANLDQMPTRFLPNGGFRIDEEELARIVEEDKNSNAFFTEWLQFQLPEASAK
jgi:membrane-associated protease RseP (regulator of RpoE activity)